MLNKAKTFIDETLEGVAVFIAKHTYPLLLVDGLITAAICLLGWGTWALWAHILIAQNFAFTYVSRARNSGSLWRHMKAAFMSNGIWWLSQIIIFSTLFNYLTGKGGIPAMLATGLFYTVFTMAGSIYAHALALVKEEGRDAVGASKKYHQVTVEEWERIRVLIETNQVTFPEPPPLRVVRPAFLKR